MTTRTVTAILRDIDTIEKSRHLDPTQKEIAITQLKRELTEAVGQGKLPLEGGSPHSQKPAGK